MIIERVLDATPCADLAGYRGGGGGEALRLAQAAGAAATIDAIESSGLRGRGGAGFPTGVKWRTVAEFASSGHPTPVVVNAAEGEPGSFKDRTLLRTNPYKVLEGALVGAHTMGGGDVVVAMKASFGVELDRVCRAIDEMEREGWCEPGDISIVLGPSHYLFGEETALLEVVAGRPPFPRVTPPYRRGVDGSDGSAGTPVTSTASTAALATPESASGTAPALVSNVETWANVAGIVVHGPEWFRSVGTDDSPGTILVTITGRTRRHGVAEVAMGTPLGEAIEAIGGGTPDERGARAAISGVTNPVIPADLFDTPLTYEDMRAAGTGLGAAGFIVFDDATDLEAVARDAARFLAVESCGQCEPCKRDGLAIAELLDAGVADTDVPALEDRLRTVTDGARCYLAQQQQAVVASLLALFPGEMLDGTPPTSPPTESLVAPIVDIRDGVAVLDESQWAKNADWSLGSGGSGASPASRVGPAGDVAVGIDTGPGAADAASTGIATEADADAVAGSVVDEGESSGDIAEGVAAGGAGRRLVGALDGFHANIDDLLATAADADVDDRDEILGVVRHELRRHLNVARRVLHPMVRRVAGDAGEDAGWVADERERRAVGLVDDVIEGTASIDALRAEVDEHVRAERDIVVPMLVAALDRDALDRLGDAVREAHSTTPVG